MADPTHLSSTQTVRVFYNLPDSHYSYTTTLPSHQDVFIHRQPRVKVTSGDNPHAKARRGSNAVREGRDGVGCKRRRTADVDTEDQGMNSESGKGQDGDEENVEIDGDEQEEEEEEEVYMGSVSLRAIVRAICRAR